MSTSHVAAEVVVDIEENLIQDVVRIITEMIHVVPRPREEPLTFCRVSDEIRQEDPDAYKPQIVRIGPFRRGDPQLLPAERIKRHFLQNLISRDGSNTLDKYVRAVSTPFFFENLRSYYGAEGRWDREYILKIVVLDGCFIIEYLTKRFLGEDMGELDFAAGNYMRLKNDLLLIENQIPFFVLQVLFDKSYIPGVHSSGKTLKKLAGSCLSTNMCDELQPIPEIVHHLLHLCHSTIGPPPSEDLQAPSAKCQIINAIKHGIFQFVFWVLSFLLACRSPLKDLGKDQWDLRPIVNATELYQAGITFRCKRMARSILDVTFRDSDGVMEIPLLTVSSTTVPLLRNLVVFEQHMPLCGNQLTTLMGFMDCLIDTSADVELLARSGVLNINLGGPEEAARFFNSVGKRACWEYGSSYLAKLFKRVKDYSSNERHGWRARMMHDYFSNPWSAISLLAAIVLLGLTILQTAYTVVAYVHPK